ncbi:hypothetical protein AB0N62_09290 [Streptomyces sp. NPDC093982]|uniref:hypothetical protein n=1 Tax=Streptomyces sp. NPDC093982 TaxID=3155077 RepID=UPI00343A1523
MTLKNRIERLRLRGATVSAAIAVTAVTTMVGASPAAAMWIDDNPGPTVDNCSPGHVCVYDTLIPVGNPVPEHRYYYYGTYNFVNEYDDHTVWNNQTGGARALLCLGYNGTNCTVTIPAGKAFHGSLTPYNSIKLVP